MELIVQLTGIRPMLQKNGRLANPLDPHTKALKELTAKRKKTDEDLAAISFVEARGSIYETHEGFVGLPTQNVWRSIKDAATAFKRGKDMERALIYGNVVESVLIEGSKVTVEEFFAMPGSIQQDICVVQRARTLRSRPILHNWQTVHRFELLEDVVDPRDMMPILQRAGRLIGVGDWRPVYGTYEVEVLRETV